MYRGRGMNRRGRGRGRNAVRMLRCEIRGRRLSVPNHPPQISPTPWFQMTLSMQFVSGTTEKRISVTDIIASLKRQLNTSTADKLLIRVQRAKVWCMAHGVPIQVLFYDLHIDESQWHIDVLEDWPTFNQMARVGYEWPISMQNIVLHGANNQNVFATFANTDNSTCVAYIYLLWRFASVQKPTFLEVCDSLDIISCSSQITDV